MIIKIIFLFIAFLAFANGQVATPCIRNPGAMPLATVVEGCTSSPCQFNRSRPPNIRISFRAPRRLNDMFTLATAYFTAFNIFLPIQVNLGPAAITCNHLGTVRCPVNQGTVVDYNFRLTGINEVPVGHIVPFEFRIVDHGPMLCVNIPIRITG